jgi:hypothetical protein
MKIAFLALWFVHFAAADPSACPAGDASSLTKWREELIDLALNGSKKSVIDNIEKCFGQDPDLHPKCTHDLYDYVNQEIFNVSHAAKQSAASKNMIIHSEKDLPPEFWVQSADGVGFIPGLVRLPKNILDTAKAKGWLAAAYRTRSTGGFDIAPNLVLVAVPNVRPKVDVYLQVSPNPHPYENMHDPNIDPQLVNLDKGDATMTIITVDRSLNPPQGDLRLMQKDYSNSRDEYTAYQWENISEAQRCMSCHSNPLRPISPRGYLTTNVFKGKQEGKLQQATANMVDALNKMMNVPGLTWRRTLVSQNLPDGNTKKIRVRLGPALDSMPYGWPAANSPTRSDEFLKDCIASADFQPYYGFGGYEVIPNKPNDYPNGVRISEIRRSMNCVMCHNNSYHGSLHEGFRPHELQFKITVDRSMPPWSGTYLPNGNRDELSDPERHALLNCLIKEAQQTDVKSSWLKSGKWLRQQTCAPMALWQLHTGTGGR